MKGWVVLRGGVTFSGILAQFLQLLLCLPVPVPLTCGFYNPPLRLFCSSEETITTVVKNPQRMRRHRSPGLPLAGAHRSETSTPEPAAARVRRVPTPRKTTIPSLFVTEAEGAEARPAEGKPRWVEVEEVIEYKVNKSPRLPRRRGVSPATSDRGATPSRAKRSPPENPNSNNSNNKLLEQSQLQGDGGASAGGGASQPLELPPLPTGGDQEQDEEDEEEEQTIIFEPDEEEDGQGPPRRLEPRTLTQGGRVLTLEDLEDYIPQGGETYLSGGRLPPTERPCEVSVLQREVGGSTVGQPVLLNVGRPLAATTARQRGGFFSRVREHLSANLFPTAAADPAASTQARPQTERHVPIQVSQAELRVKPSYCSGVQRVEGGQQSFKTQVSTQTYSYPSVGEAVTLQIGDYQQQ